MSTPRSRPTALSLAPYNGAWGQLQAAHLLRRTMFGATSVDISALAAMNMSGAVDALLTPQPASDLPVIWYHYDINGTKEGDTWVNLPYDTTNDFNRNQSLAAWWLSRMISQPRSIEEKLTLFWHNHFATGAATVSDARYMYKQHQMLRTKALGNFKSLCKAITLDPATLRYLSGNQNVRTAPNENYGRELQELFTIGKGAEVATGDYTTYTEADVKAAAHVLTGWKDDQVSVAATFSAKDHDPADKQFSARYGNRVIKGATDQAGAERELDDLLTMIFAQEATARYIVRKIYRWFVHYVIDDAVEQSIIGPLAQTLITNIFEIKPVLMELFKSEHFFDPGFVGCIIKTPLDLTIGAIRTLGVALPTQEGTITQYYGWINLRLANANMQMSVLEPPNVAGWPAYYEAPAYHEAWLNADTLDSRIKFLSDIITNKFQAAVQSYYTSSFDVTTFAIANSGNPSDPDVLIADWSKLFFAFPLAPDQVTILHNTLLPGLPNYEWTNEWSAFITNPSDAAKKKVVSDKLLGLLTYMLKMAEYQLC